MASRRTRPPFPLNLIFNIRIFYLAFIMLMIGGLAAGTLGYTGGGSSQRVRPPVEEQTPVPEETPIPVRYQRPEQVLDPSKHYFVTFKTDQGDIGVEMFSDAPQAANSFLFLAKEGFYEGLTFFFVRQGFVAQAGDPTCDAAGQGACSGTGGPGYTLPAEANQRPHEVGALVAPATVEGEEVHGSQFRILLAPDPRLDDRETVFGRVVSGLDVLTSMPDRTPCFGEEPSQANPCQPEPPPGLAIQSVVVEAT